MRDYREIVGWEATHAHNGFLDLALEIGIPAAVLCAFVFIKALFTYFSLYSRRVFATPDQVGIQANWVLLFALLLHNLVEVRWFRGFGMSTILAYVLIFNLGIFGPSLVIRPNGVIQDSIE